MADIKRYASVKPLTLATDLTSTGAVLKTTSKTSFNDEVITSSLFPTDYVWVVLQSDDRKKVEFMLVTAATILNIDTSGATIYKRGLKFTAQGDATDFDEVTANKLDWTAGETKVFIGTNPPSFYGSFTNRYNDETITAEWTFTNPKYPRMDTATPPPTDDEQFATKKYVDGIAIAGAPDASTTVKGISKLSTAPVSPTDPIAVGTNDTRMPTQGENDALVGTSGTPSATNKYVTNNDTTGTGAIPRSSITDLNLVATQFFGDGSDGAVVFDGSSTILGLIPSSSIYTMTRDIYCTNITINVGVTIRPSGYRIYANGTLTNNGTIQNNGSNGGNAVNSTANTPGAVGAAGAASATSITVPSAGGAGTAGAIGNTSFNGVGNNATNPTTLTNSIGSAAGNGGAGGTTPNAGGTGGVVTTTAAVGSPNIRDAFTAFSLYNFIGQLRGSTSGGGGGSGGMTSSNSGNAASGSGGGGGAGGGTIWIVARLLSGGGSITATGGNGGNGGNAFYSSGGSGILGFGGGGGGGGGAGGVVIIISQTDANPYTVTVTSGTGGASGLGVDSLGPNAAYNGVTGATGTIGKNYFFSV